MNSGQGLKSNIACRYNIHGVCKNTAESCEYSHDRTAQADMVCKFYLAGHCSYGNKCRYDHIKKNNNKTKEKTGETSNSTDGFIPMQTEPIEANEASWANAMEFVPGEKWITKKRPSATDGMCYAQAAGGIDPALIPDDITEEEKAVTLCPYAIQTGQCPFPDGECTYEHGDNCEYCLSACLSKTDKQQRQSHITACILKHEEDMEEAFKISESNDQRCIICLESIEEKEMEKDRRFGILSKCAHPFCLGCIRQWRQTVNCSSTKRGCPLCRVVSDFVVPSKFWISDAKEKSLLIKNYKEMLNKRPCKYFKEGTGICPFNEHCFYKHALPDGTLVEPRAKRIRRDHTAYNFDLPGEFYEHMELTDFLSGLELVDDDDDDEEDSQFSRDYVAHIVSSLFFESISLID